MLGQQMRRRALRNDPPLVHDGDLVAKRISLFHVMRGQHDGLVARLDQLDQIPEIAPGLRIQPCRGLIQKDQLRIVDQGQSEQQTLALSAGNLARVAFQNIRKRTQLDQFRNGQGAAIELFEQLQRFAHRQEFLQRRMLKLNADLFAITRPQRLSLVQHGTAGLHAVCLPASRWWWSCLRHSGRASQSKSPWEWPGRFRPRPGNAGILFDQILWQ